MNEIRRETIDTYNQSAEALSEYFRGIGPRIDDIELAFKLAGEAKNPKVVEIGCGDGRDAADITTRTNWYLGFDISESMVNLAKVHAIDGEFEVADAVSFSYPPDLDVIFAFASLLHLDKTELETVFYKAAEALRPGGIFYISTKYAPEYREEFKEDQFGKRLFYFYNQEELEELAGANFDTVYVGHSTKGNSDWIEVALRRRNDADVS